MNYLAVDFSLNSPGICLYNDKSKKYHFISYMKPGTGTKSEQKLQEEMSLIKDVTLISQPDFKKEDFYRAIYEYQTRERRFGLIGEQLNELDKND